MSNIMCDNISPQLHNTIKLNLHIILLDIRNYFLSCQALCKVATPSQTYVEATYLEVCLNKTMLIKTTYTMIFLYDPKLLFL